MSATRKTSRIELQASDQKLSEGLTKHGAAVPSFLIAGSHVPTPQIVATLQALAASNQSVQAAAAAWHAAVAADRDARDRARPLLLGVRQALQLMYSGSVDILADYGLRPRKPHVVSPEVQVAAAAKARATRAQRHTMGKNQKKRVRGDVIGVILRPVTSAPQAQVPETPTIAPR